MKLVERCRTNDSNRMYRVLRRVWSKMNLNAKPIANASSPAFIAEWVLANQRPIGKIELLDIAGLKLYMPHGHTSTLFKSFSESIRLAFTSAGCLLIANISLAMRRKNFFADFSSVTQWWALSIIRRKRSAIGCLEKTSIYYLQRLQNGLNKMTHYQMIKNRIKSQ